MNVYVMRHGTTVWNEKKIIQGRTNNRLSKNGIALTEKASKKLRYVPFDIIVCSPLMRTIQTANIMNKYHKTKVVKDLDLIEIDQGVFTKRSKESLTAEEQKQRRARAKSAGMESYEECYKRCKHFVDNIKDKYYCDSLLVITHNCCASFIEDIILEKKVDFSDPKFLRNFENAEVKPFII